MDNEQKSRIISLAKKYTYEEARPSFLDVIEKNMKDLIKQDNNDYKSIEVFAKFLYSRKKYVEAIKEFNQIADIKECRTRVLYALYKCNVMLGRYEEALFFIKSYITEKENENIVLGMKIILSSFDIILNNNYSAVSVYDKFLMNEIKDAELKEKYTELVINYNKKNFSKCIFLSEECDAICKRKKILIEFETFKEILLKVKEISQPNVYHELEKARSLKDYQRMIELLSELPKHSLKKEKLVYNSIYRLIKAGYYREIEEILLNLPVTKDNKIIINTLKKAIINQIEFENLTEIQKENYAIAIKLGKKHYKNWDVPTAYDVYRYGEYTTGNNIFLYYIGKMYFKIGEEKLALEYFEEYIKVGSDKLAKAYLYLATIYKHKHDNRKALYYSNLVEVLNKMYDTDYEMYYIRDKNNPDEDPLKMRLQGQKMLYKQYYLKKNN